MKRNRIGKDLALGAAAGLAGTALMQGMMVVTRKFAPQYLLPMKENPDEFLVAKAERLLPKQTQIKISEKAETAAGHALAFGYGMSLPAIYAAARSNRGNIWLEGAALGLGTWAVGYLGWLPAAKLTPPIWKLKPKQVVPGLLSHLLYGIAAIGLFRLARKKL